MKTLIILLILNSLVFGISSSEKGVSSEELLHLTLTGDTNASRQLGLRLIYNENECEKGISFLIIAAESNHLAILDLANLFKNEKCISPSKEKYNKYLNIYKDRVSK